MASYNKVILLGNLTRDPELRVTPKGTAICQFGLAVNRKFKDASGALREEVTFVDIEAWDKQGENISKFCTKGSPLLVEGRLKLDTWDDKTSGQKRSKLKIVLENFQLIGGRGEGGAPSSGGGAGEGEGDSSPSVARHTPPPRSAPPAGRPAPAPAPQDNIDEDVPF